MTLPRPPKPARRAFTLVELVAVLAVLAILAGLAWPRLLGMFTRSELVESGKRVRTALVQTRLRAIESGQPWIFRFTPGSGRYEVLPAKKVLADGLSSSVSPDAPFAEKSNRDRTGMLRSAGQRPHMASPVCETLPGGVVFANTADFSSDNSPAADTESLASQAIDQASRKIQLVFQANGRAPDARIVLVGSDGRRLEVAFRGLTGTATLSRPLRKPVETASEEESPGPPEAQVPQRPAADAAAPAADTQSEDVFWSDMAGEEQP